MGVFTISLARSTKAAALATKLSADALPALERGYVFAEPALQWSRRAMEKGVKFEPPRHVAYADCLFTNHGRTPVVLWVFESDLRVLSKPIEPENTGVAMGLVWAFPGGHILKTGESWRMNQRELFPLIEEAGMEAIRKGDNFVWFLGRMTYEDIFGNIRHTRFRWYSTGDSLLPHGGKPNNART